MTDDTLAIAHRVWTEIDGAKKPPRRVRRAKKKDWPRYVLVFDCETTVDHRQSLTFGCWRYYRVDRDGCHCVEEGISYADDLPESNPGGFAILVQFVAHHWAATERPRAIRLLSRSEFVEKVFFPAALEVRATVVGFNLPFDLSRLAIGATEARGFNHGGISLVLSRPAEGTHHKERRHRPRAVIKSRDSKGAFISFTKPLQPEEDLLIPEDSQTGRPDRSYIWRGEFVDCRTLAFALTGESYSLDGACEAFGVRGKSDPGGHGTITEDYVEYCRQDVAATAALYEALIAELDRHPVGLDAAKAYSPASLSKAYLGVMGITPLLERHPEFPREALGFAMASFFGGRAECRIRRVPVPVDLVDFTSMYPTVDALLDLHRFQLARHIEIIDTPMGGTGLFGGLALEDCFDREFWPRLVGFALVRPNDDILPVRAAYNGTSWGIGVNPVTSDEPLWYSLADIAAAELLSGKEVDVLRVVRFRPSASATRMHSVHLRGAVEIDPMVQDPMVTMVEERQRVKYDGTLPMAERDRLAGALKLVANAGAYGIYSEFNARERRKGETTMVDVHGRKEVFSDRVAAPEDPGKYCFPPFAACITGAARLMLAMLERCVVDLDGSWALCDTDSMAIVATEHGGLAPCPGGPERLPDGTEAVRALSCAQVEAIRERFNVLNPYDCTAVPEILKLDARGFCYSVSAKRYTLYDLDADGRPVITKYSEHGLGHFLNPTDPGSGDRQWIPGIWQIALDRVRGFEPNLPAWLSRPTMVRTTVTSPAVLKAFRHHNEGKEYADQIKPFNFLLTAAGAKPPASVPPGKPFRLVAPFSTDPAQQDGAQWIDVHHPEAGSYAITTRDGRPGMARVDTFADVLAKYETHPEAKSLGPDGKPCGRGTVGLLRRRPVTVGKIVLIGKESNRLEERSRGELSVDDLDDRITTYEDHDEWYRVVVPKLREMGAPAVAEAAGVSERRVRDWLAGRVVPHARHRAALRRRIEGWDEN
ncbi:MAG: hypothetical protein ACLQPH_13425 [Acidimicrobiales bacterium]